MSFYAIKIELLVQIDRWKIIADNSYRHLRFSPSESGEYFAINNLSEIDSELLSANGLRVTGWYPGDKQGLNTIGTLHYGPNMELLGSARILEVGPEVGQLKDYLSFLSSRE